MLLSNYSYINSNCGHSHSGITNPYNFLSPHTWRGYFTYLNNDGNGEQIKRDSFPTGTNPPYSLMMGDSGALLSSSNTTNGVGSLTGSFAMGRAISSTINGTGALTSNLSLIIQLACSALNGSGTLTASMTSIVQVASTMAGSGNLSGSLKLLAGVVCSMTGSGEITANLKGIANLEADITPFTELSPENLAASVWNSLAASFNTAGTMGNKLNSAASAGDPWSTALPGSYADGEAGKILAQIKTLTDELHRLQGLKLGEPMTVTPTSRVSGDIELVISGDGVTTTTVERQ